MIAVVKKASVFAAGTGGCTCYRIPALVLTSKGTLLAFCEARQRSCGDWAHSSIVARRCPDPEHDLATWEPQFIVKESKRLVEPRGWSEMMEAGAFAELMGWDQEDENFKPRIDVCTNNPVPIVDQDGITIHLVHCDHYDRAYHTKSVDDGVTWSGSADITRVLERMRTHFDWTVIASGPGHGLQLRHPKHAGTLIVPFWFASNHDDPNAHQPTQVGVIYSTDGGRTWEPGDFVPFTIKDPNESQLVELDDGRVMMYSRSRQPLDEAWPVRKRAFSMSADGIHGWKEYQFDGVIPEPICLGAFNKLRRDASNGGSMLLYSVCDSVEENWPPGAERRNLTLFMKEEHEPAWSRKRTIEPGPSAYSDLAVDEQRGLVYCLYEDGSMPGHRGPYNGISIACIDVAWMQAASSTGHLQQRRSNEEIRR